MNSHGRPTPPETAAAVARKTFTGDRALDMEEALIFETGRLDATASTWRTRNHSRAARSDRRRRGKPQLPGLTGPEAVRHYVRLSRDNYSINAGLYPLGSCTMKHNPRLNEKSARLPASPTCIRSSRSRPRGALHGDRGLADALMTMTGMSAIAMSPKAGGTATLRHDGDQGGVEARGEAATRRVVLVPDSGHGTNPATAALIGFPVRSVPAGDDGNVGVEAVESALAPDVAAIMLTNPNTCGCSSGRSSESPKPCATPGRISIATARTSTPSSARRGRETSASTPCTSICTRRFRRRTAAAGRAPARSRCHRGRPLCAGSVRHARRGRRSVWSSTPKGPLVRPHERIPRPDGDVRAGAKLHFSHGADGCGRRRKTRSCPPITSGPRSPT